MQNGLFELYRNCSLCPNMCGADRLDSAEADSFGSAEAGRLGSGKDLDLGSGEGLDSGSGGNSNFYSAGESGAADRDVSKNGGPGVCEQSSTVRVAWSGLHRGEEPPVSGQNGSGMIFFCGCPLHCRFCQNWQISWHGGRGFEQGTGKEPLYGGVPVSCEELARIMVELQAAGAASINLVTGTHFIPSIIMALEMACSSGLVLPVVWNSSGYETVEALRLMDPWIDLYLLDVKTLDRTVASRFCGTSRYVDVILPVLRFLKRRHSVTWFGNRPAGLTDVNGSSWDAGSQGAGGAEIQGYSGTEKQSPGDTKIQGAGGVKIQGVKKRDAGMGGVLVRHLVFPGTADITADFIKWFAENFRENFQLSLMTQFVPPRGGLDAEPLSRAEYRRLAGLVEDLGIDGFLQEQGDDDPLWIPDFTEDEPFPEGFANALPYFLELKHRFGK